MGYLEHPAILYCFSLPLVKSTPAISNFITLQRNTGQRQSGSGQGISLRDLLKADKCIDRKQSQTDWTITPTI